LRGLGSNAPVHLWLDVKHTVDFLLAISELFSTALMAEALIKRNLSISAFSGGVTLSANFRQYKTLTVIVSNGYLFYVSFACLGLGFEDAGLGLERTGLGLGTAGLDYKTE